MKTEFGLSGGSYIIGNIKKNDRPGFQTPPPDLGFLFFSGKKAVFCLPFPGFTKFEEPFFSHENRPLFRGPGGTATRFLVYFEKLI
ncbi:MAG: hypothetical protein PVG49_16750 [Desulfobacteraceae bacterium]|jgi:hypothetical protein